MNEFGSVTIFLTMKEKIPELEIGDPLEFFTRQAFSLIRELSIPSAFIDEAVSIVKGAFGESWLREQFRTKEIAVGHPVHPHQLGNAFMVAGHPQVVEILELAVYVKRLIMIPRLNEVLAMMRTSYIEGFLQLAWAYRFLRGGAKDLELEPLAAHGRKADILCTIEGQTYLIECYVPKTRRVDSTAEFLHSNKRILEATGNNTTRICVQLTSSIVATDRRRIEKRILEALSAREGPATVLISDAAGEITIEDFSHLTHDPDFDPSARSPDGALPNGADWAVSQFSVRREDIPKLRLSRIQTKQGSRIVFWRPPLEKEIPPLDERVEAFVRKLDAKMAQTNREDEPKRLIIASTTAALNFESVGQDFVARVWNRLMQRHRRLSALLLVRRTWMTANRFRYLGYFMDGKPLSQFPEQFSAHLDDLERTRDVLQEWH